MKIFPISTETQSGYQSALDNFRATMVIASRWRAAINGILLFTVFLLVMAKIQFSTPDMPDNDGFYHIRFASLMRSEGLKPYFPWMQLTILNSQDFSDHHFLFHVALIPFTFGDLRIGAKWAAVVFSSLAFLCIWWLLYNQNVPNSGLWALGLLAVSQAFLYRMSITRAQSLSLAVLAIGLHCLLKGKYKWLLPLGFLYVWLYDAFPLLLAITACYTIALWLVERRLDYRPVLYTGLGIGLGLIINPYFPHNLIFFYRHLTPKLSSATAVNVGSEWYPYTTLQLLENSPLGLIAFLLGILGLGFNTKRIDSRTTTSLFLVIMFGMMLFQARRFIEYFPAFSLIFAAFAWTPPITSYLIKNERFFVALLDFRKKGEIGKRRSVSVKWVIGILFILVLLPGIWISGRGAISSIKASQPYTLYSSASHWLENNTPAGSRVFQTDWDDFPRLFYYNIHNTYLVGLDPTYLQMYSPQLYDLWVKITQGKDPQPSQYIYAQFGAEYVLSDLLHSNFITQADKDTGLKIVYRDQEAVIYQVLNVK